MYSAINPVTPRFFPQPLTQRLGRLTEADFTTPRTEIPPTQKALSYHEQTPPPAREILMAAALAYQGPVMAKSLIEEQKKKEATNYSADFSMAV